MVRSLRNHGCLSALLTGSALVIAAAGEPTPHSTVSEGVSETAYRHGAPIETGAFTLSLILAAYEPGSDMLKVFSPKSSGWEHVEAGFHCENGVAGACSSRNEMGVIRSVPLG